MPTDPRQSRNGPPDAGSHAWRSHMVKPWAAKPMGWVHTAYQCNPPPGSMGTCCPLSHGDGWTLAGLCETVHRRGQPWSWVATVPWTTGAMGGRVWHILLRTVSILITTLTLQASWTVDNREPIYICSSNVSYIRWSNQMWSNHSNQLPRLSKMYVTTFFLLVFGEKMIH